MERVRQIPILGVEAFDELVIGTEVWNGSHSRHQQHRNLHAAEVHRFGIVSGLEVVASTKSAQTVVVAPGVAIDPFGRTITVPEPISITIKELGITFLVLEYAESIDDTPSVVTSSGTRGYRLREGAKISKVKRLPETPCLELARIERTTPSATICNPSNPFEPAKDEINSLFRVQSFPFCSVELNIGELLYFGKSTLSEWKPNRAGLLHLLQQGSLSGCRLRYVAPTSGLSLTTEAEETLPDLLYMAGFQGFQPPTDEDLEGLKRFLERGGTLFGEAIALSDDGGYEEFASDFRDLALLLGAELQPVQQGNDLLRACHVFPLPPFGAQEGVLYADLAKGIIAGTMNYGAAWAGQVQTLSPSLARDRVRTAIEFGHNLLSYASQHKRDVYLKGLAAQ